MQRLTICLLMLLLLNFAARAQNVSRVISAVRKSQKQVKTFSYHVVRHDTLVTGETRILTAQVKVRVDSSDKTFGFLFVSKEDSANCQLVFNGNLSFQTDDKQQIYSISTSQSTRQDLLYQPGGRMIIPDLISLDTSGSNLMTLSEDARFFYLTIHYPDLIKFDVTDRYKKITIAKSNMLPVEVKKHQQTLDKVQDLSWKTESLLLNEPGFNYDFHNPDFTEKFRLQIPRLTQADPLLGLKGMQAPSFELKSFDNKLFSLKTMAGKVVLLDFWEVWCGPCIESMPKIQDLFRRFKDNGLLVFGIINDVKQMESSIKWVRKKTEIQFPMLVGSAKLKKEYYVNAIPEYVLIDRKGKITFIGLGYSDEIESEIKKALNDV